MFWHIQFKNSVNYFPRVTFGDGVQETILHVHPSYFMQRFVMCCKIHSNREEYDLAATFVSLSRKNV